MIPPVKEDKHPVLSAAIKRGHVYISGRTFVGIAANGTHVTVGSVLHPDRTERFLKNVSPINW